MEKSNIFQCVERRCEGCNVCKEIVSIRKFVGIYAKNYGKMVYFKRHRDMTEEQITRKEFYKILKEKQFKQVIAN